MSGNKPFKNKIKEENPKVFVKAEAKKPSRTLEKLEEARKIATVLQEKQKSGTELKAKKRINKTFIDIGCKDQGKAVYIILFAQYYVMYTKVDK